MWGRIVKEGRRVRLVGGKKRETEWGGWKSDRGRNRGEVGRKIKDEVGVKRRKNRKNFFTSTKC